MNLRGFTEILQALDEIAVEMFWTFVRFEYALKAVSAHRYSCGAFQRLFC